MLNPYWYLVFSGLAIIVAIVSHYISNMFEEGTWAHFLFGTEPVVRSMALAFMFFAMFIIFLLI